MRLTLLSVILFIHLVFGDKTENGNLEDFGHKIDRFVPKGLAAEASHRQGTSTVYRIVKNPVFYRK